MNLVGEMAHVQFHLSGVYPEDASTCRPAVVVGQDVVNLLDLQAFLKAEDLHAEEFGNEKHTPAWLDSVLPLRFSSDGQVISRGWSYHLMEECPAHLEKTPTNPWGAYYAEEPHTQSVRMLPNPVDFPAAQLALAKG